jgi:type IV pilus assembly protein PilP
MRIEFIGIVLLSLSASVAAQQGPQPGQVIGAVKAATQTAQPAPAPSAPVRPVAPAPGKPATPAPSTEAPVVAVPPPPDTFTYVPEGRRDPFVSLIGTGEPRSTSRRGDGAAGVSVGEMSVRGVLENGGRMVAMIEGPDKMTYIVHAGDRLLDGTIKTINAQGLVVSQEVNDPLSIVKQRDVTKLLRSLEGAKQ